MAAFHPQIVHFAIALLVVGVLFRAVSLLKRPAFVSPAALTLLILGTIAVLLAVQSGTAAHGPVERVPGSRAAVVEHEQWGARTHNVFVGVIAIEAVALLLWTSPKKRYAHAASAIVGLVGLFCLYETASAGGRLVYSYAGGVGIRSGDPADVERLLLAGLYHQAQAERKAGRPAEASALLTQAGQRFRNDPEVQLAAAESLLVDRKDSAAALAALEAIKPPRENRALRIRHGTLTADALEAAGQREGAAAVVQGLLTEFPDAARLKQRLDALKSGAPPR
jgi:uncharacterized membrane protein